MSTASCIVIEKAEHDHGDAGSLGDFGLASVPDAVNADATTLMSAVPAGVAAGTPYAMAPEQMRGEAADQRRPRALGADL
jgi:serine/threonine protein kinase